MSNYSDHDRVIALGGIFQAARLVRDSAREGHADPHAQADSIRSLFDFDPPDVAEVFGGEAGVAHGLRTLVSQLESPRERDLEIAQYVIALIHLADKLKRDDGLAAIADDLEAMHQRSQDFDLPEPTRLAQIEAIYQTHVSVKQPQIMVRGEPVYLQNSDNTARIRALLLAGIRAALLWRQCGGSKLQLLFKRRGIAQMARKILDRVEN